LRPWHIVKAATDALDEVRRQVWNEARRSDNTQLAKQLKRARFAPWKRPENLTDRQQAKLAWIQTLNAPIYRAYLLKEQRRGIYHAPTIEDARAARQLAEVGTALPLGTVRQARQDHHQPARRNRGGASAWLVEREN
jgi:transposase